MQMSGSGPNPEAWDQDISYQAAPHLDCIKWMLSTDTPGGPCPCYARILGKVAHFHDTSALQWIRQNCTLPIEFWTKHISQMAASMGDQIMLEWLRAQDPPVPWDARVCTAAAARGNIKMLRWLRCQDPPAPWDEATTAAAARSNLKTLQWLRAQDSPCPCDQKCCSAAASSGKLDILIWLRAQEPPCP